MPRLQRAIVGVAVLCGVLAGCSTGRHGGSATNASVSPNQETDADCTKANDKHWRNVDLKNYEPGKTLYNVAVQFCPGETEGRRVRVTDANLKKVFFTYDDDWFGRVETLRLLANSPPQLFIMTESSGTDDRETWHIIGELNGELEEWKIPDYDKPATRLLRTDESFCCKDWNFHLRGNHIVLARGIYEKNDGNARPTGGGILVELKPAPQELAIVKVQRISPSEYEHWTAEPFCSLCTLE